MFSDDDDLVLTDISSMVKKRMPILVSGGCLKFFRDMKTCCPSCSVKHACCSEWNGIELDFFPSQLKDSKEFGFWNIQYRQHDHMTQRIMVTGSAKIFMAEYSDLP